MNKQHRNTIIGQSMHASLQLTGEIRHICHPLVEHTEIRTFVHIRCFKDGTRIYVSNNPDWVQHYYQNRFFDDHHHSQTYGGEHSQGISVWSGFKQDDIFKAAQEMNIWNGVTLYQKTQNSLDAFLFASTNDKHHMINFYMGNVDLLNHFIFYFKDKAHKLLRLNLKDLIIPPQDDYEATIKEHAPCDHHALCDALKIDRYHLSDNTHLTQREVECIQWAAKGKSAEEIAGILGIAKRTVEIHINNVKQKLSCYKVTHMLQKASSLGIITD